MSSPQKKDQKHRRRFQSEPPPMDALFTLTRSLSSRRNVGMESESYSMRNLMQDNDEAESKIVSILENRRRGATYDWNSAVEGENPPLKRMPSSSKVLDGDDDDGYDTEEEENVRKHAPRILDLVRRLRTRSSANPKLSTVSDMLVEPTDEAEEDVFGKDTNDTTTHTDKLISGALMVNEMFEADSEDEKTDSGFSTGYADDDEHQNLLPLKTSDISPDKKYGTSGSVDRKQKKRKKRQKGQLSQFWCLPRSGSGLAEILNPKSCSDGFVRFLFASSISVVAVPCVIAAFLLYYFLGNPEFDFTPGDAKLSWWLLFTARQCVTLETAIVIEYFMVEGLALRTKWIVYAFGPLVTLGLIQAKGWPLICIFWSVLDLCLLHGDNRFQQNWLGFLDLGLFSKSNIGGDFLYSDFYLRSLLALLLAGLCHGIKRTSVAMHFGKSTLLTYKNRLEVILADIVLITEVAELVAELEMLDSINGDNTNPLLRAGRTANKWKNTLDVKFTMKGSGVGSDDENGNPEDVQFATNNDDSDLDDDEEDADSDEDVDNNDDDDDDDIDDEEENEEENVTYSGFEIADGQELWEGNMASRTPSGLSLSQVDTGLTNSTENDGNVTSDSAPMKKNPDRFGSNLDVNRGGTVSSGWSSSGTTKIKRLLERWDEPRNKLDKTSDASIADILKFRKALTYMDDPLPFGQSFGPAATRDQCIKSAQKTYRRLLRATKSSVLNYDVIKLLTITEEAEIEEAKEASLRVLFRPDKSDQLTLLAFVQSCDTVYKKLRFFRASVGNASVINQVLESIVDSMVNFALSLVILSMLQVNPYPILVSLSTIVVSLAFAVGSSASRFLEGVLLIAVRRPYDIGDRIVMNLPHIDNVDSVKYSWFVEDINLWSTTLRFATTNEVASLNNGSIPGLRIVNCNRSPNALISLDLKFDLGKITGSGKLELFQMELEGYLKDRPRIYEGLIHLRCESISENDGLANFQLRVRHRRTWQDAPLILKHKAELLWYCMEQSKEMGITYLTDMPEMKVFTVGTEVTEVGDEKPPVIEGLTFNT